MIRQIPRVVLAGTNSGCGKTTVSCALMQALVNRKLNTGAFKCGPDYIDPMFHSRIIGAESSNLDSFFFDENTLRYLLAENAAGRDISIIEGVMGYYDGISMDSFAASTYEVADLTDSPVILTVGARGASLSVLAVIDGFLRFTQNSRIKGVILNQCTAMTYQMLAEQINRHFDGRIIPLGFMPVMKDCSIESRHLGLITAEEITDLKEKLQTLAEQAEQSIDIDAVIRLAQSAPPVAYEDIMVPVSEDRIRVAVARDRAFCFYYEDSLAMLRRMGAEIISFSPLNDRHLPDDIHGIYLGGGYPELYAQQLSDNKEMLADIRHALSSGIPCIAECGGFMYLTDAIGKWPMAGSIHASTYDTGRLCRFGYVTLTAKQDNILCSKGEKIRAHEFHHWDCSENGNGFTAEKLSGKNWECVHVSDTLYAGFPHFNFYSNPDFALNFYRACLKEKHKND